MPLLTFVHIDRTQDSRHKKPCIYSIHVHPDGKRLATGSLGNHRKKRSQPWLKTNPIFQMATLKFGIQLPFLTKKQREIPTVINYYAP